MLDVGGEATEKIVVLSRIPANDWVELIWGLPELHWPQRYFLTVTSRKLQEISSYLSYMYIPTKVMPLPPSYTPPTQVMLLPL